MNSILNQLESTFKATDEKVLQSNIKYALSIKKEFLEAKQANDIAKCQYLSDQVSKPVFKAFQYSNDNYVIREITKVHEQNIAKRNKTLSAKLEKIGIKEVIGQSVTITPDGLNGFTGLFEVMTNEGKKTVEIRTIVAGGAIQCLHQRTLCNVLLND